jgi:hypothetical protein
MTTATVPHITILGLIDFLMDQLEIKADRLEVRNQLLSAIMAGLNSKLLDNPQISSKMGEISTQLSEQDPFDKNLQKITNHLVKSDLSEINTTTILLTEAKDVLTAFVTKTEVSNKKELLDNISILLS